MEKNSHNENAAAIAMLIRRLVEPIILHPGQLEIMAEPVRALVPVEITAHVSDAKRIVGTKGGHYRALRTIAAVLGSRMGMEVEFAPIQDNGGTPDQYPSFKKNPDWPRSEIETLLADTLALTLAAPVNIESAERGSQTIYTVFCDAAENHKTVAVMSEAMKLIFSSIGMAKGHPVSVALERK